MGSASGSVSQRNEAQAGRERLKTYAPHSLRKNVSIPVEPTSLKPEACESYSRPCSTANKKHKMPGSADKLSHNGDVTLCKALCVDNFYFVSCQRFCMAHFHFFICPTRTLFSASHS